MQHQLGHLASTLTRIRSQIQRNLLPDEILETVREGRHLAEWLIVNPDVHIHNELLELREKLEDWQPSLIQLNLDHRQDIALSAQKWSVCILNHSNLLSEQNTSPTS
ncbi:hypothetical protein ACQ4M3_25715 [Leptolyngbya sp. AN03gr2]|uniref:hypothetical protein n=1 Tax=unclassified Leptolyngbya TaxID=2650499 RepID=UPI003D322380